MYSEAISRAADRQKPIIKSAQSMYRMWRCTTTKAAASAGASTRSTPSSPVARSELKASPEDEGYGLNFEKSWSNFVINGRKDSLRIFVIFILMTVESSGQGLLPFFFFFSFSVAIIFLGFTCLLLYRPPVLQTITISVRWRLVLPILE